MKTWHIQCVLNADYGLKHRHYTASQDLRKEIVNVQYCLVKLLSEKLTEETIASNQNLRFLNVKLICIILLCSCEANVLNNFYEFAFFLISTLLYKFLCSILKENIINLKQRLFQVSVIWTSISCWKDWLFEANRPKTSAIWDARVIWYASFVYI